MQQTRTVDTAHGPIRYTLTRKRVKNLNLRINARGEISLSVPFGVSVGQADAFVAAKSGWISARLSQQRPGRELLPEVGRDVCYAMMEQAVDRVWPLVAREVIRRPDLKLRAMRSQWGNCHWAQGYITLNTALQRCPEHLRDYVALHELVHFLHHDHGSGFYACMDALMPDWRERRKQLKEYSAALYARDEGKR